MPDIYRNFKLRDTSRLLRKNLTKQEKRLWYDYMALHKVRWYKQRIIDNFIVDFYCSKAKLVVELDGSQHFTEQGEAYDKERTAILESYGIKVIRFSNYDVDTNFEGVCSVIDKEVKTRVAEQPPQSFLLRQKIQLPLKREPDKPSPLGEGGTRSVTEGAYDHSKE